jgi:hypothetical protein
MITPVTKPLTASLIRKMTAPWSSVFSPKRPKGEHPVGCVILHDARFGLFPSPSVVEREYSSRASEQGHKKRWTNNLI